MKTFVILLLFYMSPASAEPLKGIYMNNLGTEALKNKQVANAQQQYLRALSENSENHVARINLGLTFVFNEELDKAKKEFDLALKAPGVQPEVKYWAHFNKARAHHQAKEVEPALKHYQESLNLDKESLQSKANIELLVQQQNGQGQGGSGDEQENQNKQDQDQQGQGDQKDQEKDQQKDGDKKEDQNKKPNKPQDLSEKDIEKILEELKNQEQKIRALEYGKESKQDENGKTW